MAYNSPKADLVAKFLCVLVVCAVTLSLSGCGFDLEKFAEVADAGSLDDSQLQLKSAMASIECGQSSGLTLALDSPRTSESLTTGPYADRDNPFEFAVDVDFESQSGGEGKLEVKLFGFVGDQSPRAIVSLNGNTRLMSVGDSWQTVEVIEIHPPSIRFRTAGVTSVLSLLGTKSSD